MQVSCLNCPCLHVAPVINSPLHLKEGEQAITIWAKSAVVVATQISPLPASGLSDERATLFFVALYEVDDVHV